MKGTSTLMQFLHHLANAITTIFQKDHRPARSFRNGNYYYIPQAEPFIFPQPNKLNDSSATHEYTNISNNAALNNDAAFTLLPVQSERNNSLKAIGKRNYFSIIFAILFSITSVQSAFATVTGPGSAWQYCRRITLSTATPSTDYQVKVTLTTAALGSPYNNIKTDGSDLRFYDINNNACSYWIETNPFSILGTNVIWVKVASSGATAVYMYYGNAAATAVTNGATTFPFFDDFNGASLGANWTSSGTGVSVSAGQVTLANSTGVPNPPAISSAYTPSSTSYLLETKHRETAYNRNRFYAATTSAGGFSPDYGYFSSLSTAQSSAQIFFSTFPGSTTVTSNTNYLSQWQITDGSTYNWFTYNYTTGAVVTNGNRTSTFASNVRTFFASVTEVSGTSSIVDWVRLRKWNGSSATPDITSTVISPQVTNPSATITATTNAPCTGSTGSATVTGTGGGTPYTYSWNSSPVQTTQTATNLPAGSYTATVTENTIGISATAVATIVQTTAPSSSVTSQANLTCFNNNTGQIVVGASGGSGSGYTYSINNGLSYQPSNTFNALGAGAYKIRVKDSNGCESKSVQ